MTYSRLECYPMHLKNRSGTGCTVTMFTGMLLWFVTLFASAATQNITATFRPDPSSPMRNTFKNTTPQSGTCPGHMPARCEALGIFSIRTNDINFRSNGPIVANHADSRKGVMFKVPSEWRSLDVVSENGERGIVEMRISGVGNRFDLPNPPGVSAWSSLPANWTYPPSPCLFTGMFAAGPTLRLWFWIVPEGGGACAMPTPFDVPWISYANFEYAYELRTPNPLSMPAGKYRGTMSYRIGPNQDFDFGDLMIPNDDVLVFNFTLDVEHILKVDIPPGGDRVELTPQGGWQSWVQQGRGPQRLFRDQTFNLWTSTAFKMQLQCGDVFGNTCAITNALGHQVPVDIAVSLPGGISDRTRQHVRQRLLRLDGVGTELFQPTHYVDRRPGTLHFEIQKPYVEQMLTPKHAGQRYSGSVTVIWDSET